MRRTRTLGLGASVRSFNELAVPGLGGVWFGKQILLALIGVQVASQVGAHKIEVANAIEALACWLAFKNRNWTPDPRLRGNRKLPRTDISFTMARKRGFYVSQPMRMATVQALPALGLVDSQGTRFNNFTCTPSGMELVKAATEQFRPYNRSLLDHLVLWVRGEDGHIENDLLRRALSPVEPLPKMAAAILTDRLMRGGSQESPDATNRRRDALQWIQSRHADRDIPVSWHSQPVEIRSKEHWNDLHSGALLFEARGAAFSVLEALELRMPAERKLTLNGHLATSLEQPLDHLRRTADAFLKLQHTDALARAFCRECRDDDPLTILRSLVKRDDRVLRLQGTQICTGPAFRGGDGDSKTESEADPDAETAPSAFGFPENISQRISNLYWLNLDLQGELDRHLVAQVNEGDDQ